MFRESTRADLEPFRDFGQEKRKANTDYHGQNIPKLLIVQAPSVCAGAEEFRRRSDICLSEDEIMVNGEAVRSFELSSPHRKSHGCFKSAHNFHYFATACCIASHRVAHSDDGTAGPARTVSLVSAGMLSISITAKAGGAHSLGLGSARSLMDGSFDTDRSPRTKF